MSELLPAESARLAELEKTIRSGLSAFYDVAAALEEVRRSPKLYRGAGYASFEDYCDRRWNMTRQRAYQLLAASEVRANLSTRVDILPSTEYQARPLAALSPERQVVAWQVAVESADGGQPTAGQVRASVEVVGVLRDFAGEAEDALGAGGRARLEESEQGELRRKLAERTERVGEEKRQGDLGRMAERAGQARRIAERYGLAAVASHLRAAEKAMEGVG